MMRKRLSIPLFMHFCACSLLFLPDKDLYREDNPTRCQDTADNDNDGDTDCQDEECAAFCVPESCGNGILEGDEECELIDDGPPCDLNCKLIPEVCDNLLDDNGDLLIDCEDPQCLCTAEICTNGTDDDNDGDIDCQDVDCQAAPECNGVEICGDTLDNDSDGFVDCADIDCQASCQESGSCSDNIDNDADGLIDCNDSDCACVGCGDGGFASGDLCPTTFESKTFLSIDARSLAVGDIDNDTDIDLVLSNRLPGTASLLVLFNDGSGSFSESPLATPGSTHDVLLLDLKGDASLDLLASLPDTDRLLFMEGNGDGTFGAPQEITVANLDGPEGLHATDLNNDQRLDIVVASSLNSLVIALESASTTPQLSLTPRGSISVSNNPTRVSSGLFRPGDNLPDLALIYQDRTEATIIPNNAPGFSFVGLTDLDLPRPTDLAVGSSNGDAEDDLVLTIGEDDQVLLLASGNLPPIQTINVDFFPTALCLADFDNDGDDDVATAHQSGVVNLLHHNLGVLEFFSVVVGGAGSFVDVACADLNGDGALDLVGLGQSSISVLLFNP